MRKKWIAVLEIICLFLFCLLGTSQTSFQRKISQKNFADNRKHKVVLISKSSQSDFWKTVYAGANAAATEFNLDISFDAPLSEENSAYQNHLVHKAVADGAEVIIFSAVDYNANAQAIDEAVTQGTKVVVIDSDVNSSLVSCRISTDNYKAGMMAAEAALQCDEGTMNIGIVNFDKKSANGQAREYGFRTRIDQEDSRVTIIDAINVKSTLEDAKRGVMRMLEQHPEINVIVTFNEWTSLGVGYGIRELGMQDDTHVVAFDNNEISVGMLETGEVDALIVQNPYAMGYLGVEEAYDLIHQLNGMKPNVDTETTIINRDNMFDEAYQRVLFPVYK